jgi:hypothetical protein
LLDNDTPAAVGIGLHPCPSMRARITYKFHLPLLLKESREKVQSLPTVSLRLDFSKFVKNKELKLMLGSICHVLASAAAR